MSRITKALRPSRVSGRSGDSMTFARLTLLLAVALLGGRVRAAVPDKVDYARDVLPILSDACYHCHGPDEKARKANLRFDTKDGAFRLKDGKSVIVPGKTAESELVRRINSSDPDEKMPPEDGVRKL